MAQDEIEAKYKSPASAQEMQLVLREQKYTFSKQSHEVDTYYLVSETIDHAPEGLTIGSVQAGQYNDYLFYSSKNNVSAQTVLKHNQAEKLKALFGNMRGECYLRLRHDLENNTRCITYKQKTDNPDIRPETEIELTESQFAVFTHILQNEYGAKCIVDKVRMTYQSPGEPAFEVGLDTVRKLGEFVELENKSTATLENLTAAAQILGLKEADRIKSLKYADMMLALKQK